MLYRLRMMSQNELRSLPDISEGLENRLYTAIQRGTSIEEILSLAKCKRYTLSRLQRCLLHALLGLTKSNTTLLPQYIRVYLHRTVGIPCHAVRLRVRIAIY